MFHPGDHAIHEDGRALQVCGLADDAKTVFCSFTREDGVKVYDAFPASALRAAADSSCDRSRRDLAEFEDCLAAAAAEVAKKYAGRPMTDSAMQIKDEVLLVLRRHTLNSVIQRIFA